jgi:homogentisate 1,2-dioxygenase
LRWDPVPIPTEKTNFIQGIRTMTTAGDALGQSGMASHIYLVNDDMVDDYFFNADGEMLVVPESGSLSIFTEMGIMEIEPSEIALIPRGMMFKVARLAGTTEARGYICENYGAKFTCRTAARSARTALPIRAISRRLSPAYEEKETPCRLHRQMVRPVHITDARPFAARRSRLARQLCALQIRPARPSRPSARSCSTIPIRRSSRCMTAPSGEEGTANVDFVIFPPRWLVAENTFRPPWYHRNIMSEFMGLIYGQYDAKEKGFVPGGISLHNMMLAHGPDAGGF